MNSNFKNWILTKLTGVDGFENAICVVQNLLIQLVSSSKSFVSHVMIFRKSLFYDEMPFLSIYRSGRGHEGDRQSVSSFSRSILTGIYHVTIYPALCLPQWFSRDSLDALCAQNISKLDQIRLKPVESSS